MLSTLAARLRGRASRDVGRLGSAQLGILVASAASGLLLARILGPSDLGAATLLVATPAFLLGVLDFGTDDLVTRFAGRSRAAGNDLGVTLVARLAILLDAGAAGGVLVLLLLLRTPIATRVVHHPAARGQLLVAGLLLLVSSPSRTCQAGLRVFDRFGDAARLQLASAVVRSAAGLAAALAGAGISSLLWGAAAGALVDGPVASMVLHRRVLSGINPRWVLQRGRLDPSERRSMRRMLVFGDLGRLAGVVAKQGDKIILGAMRSVREVGYYQLASSIAGLAGNAVGPLQAVLFQRLSLVPDRAELDARVRRMIAEVGMRLAAPAAIAFAAAASVGALALPLLGGRAFAPARMPFIVLAAGSAVWLALFWVRPVIFAYDEYQFWALNGSVVALLSVPAMLVSARYWGATGLALVQTSLSVVLGHAAALVWLQRRHAVFTDREV